MYSIETQRRPFSDHGTDLNPGLNVWLNDLRSENNLGGVIQADYIATVLIAANTARERVTRLDPFANQRPLREVLALGNTDLPRVHSVNTINPLVVKYPAQDWLSSHPESSSAGQIAKKGLAAPLQTHVEFVEEMYRASRQTQGFSATDTLLPPATIYPFPTELSVVIQEDQPTEATSRTVPLQLPMWVSRGAEDTESAEGLFNYLSPILKGYFLKRLPEEAEDLVQVTILEIFQNLYSFSNARQDQFVNKFHGWVFGVARNHLNNELRSTYKKRINIPVDEYFTEHFGAEETVSIPEETKPDSQRMEELMPRLNDSLRQILTMRELQAVLAIMKGVDFHTVAKQLGVKKSAVIYYLYNGRKKIEALLLFPKGFQRLDKMQSHKSLLQAAQDGRLQASKFLGRWYTDDTAIERFRQKSYLVDQDLIAKGYLPISSCVTSREYQQLLSNSKYRRQLTIKGRRIYISEENLAEFRRLFPKPATVDTVQGLTHQPIISPLNAFSTSEAERQRLLIAAKTGKLNAVKLGKKWFTTDGAFENYANNYPLRPHHDLNTFPKTVEQNKPTSDFENDNLQTLVYKTKKGSLIAKETLRSYIATCFGKTFGFKLSGDINEFINISAEKAIVNLETFIYTGKFYFWREFKTWIYEQATLMIGEERMRRKAEKNIKAPTEKPNERKTNFDIPREKLILLLTKAELQIYDLKLQGLTRKEIALKIGSYLTAVSALAQSTRRKIEEAFIKPAGLRRASETKGKSLRVAAKNGTVKAFLILDNWYVSDQAIKDYELRKVGFHSTLGEDHLLLSRRIFFKSLTHAE